VVDSVIISSFADTTILVINADRLTRKPFLNAVEELKRAKAKIIGVVFNGVKVRKGDYFYMNYYRYYRQEYYGEEVQSEKLLYELLPLLPPGVLWGRGSK